MSPIDNLHPLPSTRPVHLVGGEVVVNVKVVPSRKVMIRSEFQPFSGQSERPGLVCDFIPEPPMKYSCPVSLKGKAINSSVPALVEVGRIAKVLRVGAEGNLPEMPESRVFVVRIHRVIDPRIFEELANDLTIYAASFYLGHVTIFVGNFHSRPESARAIGSSDHSIDHCNGFARRPLGVGLRKVIDCDAIFSGCRVRIHKEMVRFVDIPNPTLCHLWRDVPCYVGALWICNVDLIYIERHQLQRFLLNQMENVTGESREFTTQHPMICKSSKPRELTVLWT